MKRWIKRLGRIAKIGALIAAGVVLIPVVVALARVGIECRPFSSGSTAQTAAPDQAGARSTEFQTATAALEGYTRPEDQTYLTLPEWYIVYSSDEYAAFIADQPPSQFPYFRAIGQFWQSYYDVCAVTREQYSFNGGYHLSLVVIGASFTVENILKGIYENTIGRLAEALSSSALTEEDAYARAVAAEYGTFLHTIPWYEFPFGAKLRGLWRETPLWGPNIIRKAERKAALSAEYGSKAIYGWLIGLGTQGAYEAEDLDIYAVAQGLTPELATQEPQIQIVKSIDDQTAIVKLPRYEAFTQIVPRLAQQNVRLIEIAGNDEILITLIAPRTWSYRLEAGELLFAMPILTQPDRQRVAVKVPVTALHEIIRELNSSAITLEHIYDY